MGDPAAFLLRQLIDVRVFVVFIASASRAQGALDGWPQVWLRDDHGAWAQFRFGRQHRAHELACLLAWRHDNLHEKTVDMYFGRVPDDAGRITSEPKHNAAKKARQTLEERLEEKHLRDLLVIPGKDGGLTSNDGDTGWSLLHALSDVELASIAIGQGEWEAASLLTHGADGRLIGFARLPRKRRRSFRLRLRASDRDAWRVRLPRELMRAAEHAARAVRKGATEAGHEPPSQPDWIERMLVDWLSGPAPRIVETPAQVSQPVPPDVLNDEEVITDAEVVTEAPAQPAGADALGLAPSAEEDGHATHESRSLPLPAAGRSLETVGESALAELVSRSPIPPPKPASLDQLPAQTVLLPVSGGELVVPVDPLINARPSRRRSFIAMAALVVVLAIGLAIVLTSRTSRPQQSSLIAQHARIEQESPAHNVKTFKTPRDLATDQQNPEIPANRTVLVKCREYAPSLASNQGGYFYQLITTPWRGRFAPADTFLNGDPGSAYSLPHAPKVKNPHNYDTAVPICATGQPGGSVEIPRQSTTATFRNPGIGQPAGPVITGGARVVVSCKVASDTPTAEPGGFVYRISSQPWNDRYYAPAPAFRNTVPANSTDLQLDDVDVPLCPA